MKINLVHPDIHKSDISLVLWHSEESTEELTRLAKLDQAQWDLLHEIRLEKRRREWLVTRILLSGECPGDILKTRESGKPYLLGGKGISISHSGDLAGIVLKKGEIGLDIQPEDPKLLRIATKFCHHQELERLKFQRNQLAYLAIIWALKEAVFKYFGKNVHFADDIISLPFELTDRRIKAHYKGVHGEKLFDAYHYVHNGFHILHTD
jgi:4'-phosphopantetheinyl transferase